MRCMDVTMAAFMLAGAMSARPASAQVESPQSPGERVLLLMSSGDARQTAPDTQGSLVDCAPEGIYQRGQWSVSYLTGYYGCNLGPVPAPFSMLPEIVRLNRVIDDPRPERLL